MAGALRDEAAGQTGAAAPDGAEPLVDLDFRRGTGLDGVTCVRPTPGYVEDGRGVWRLVPPDTPRLSDCGLLVEEARTNWIRNNAMAGAAEGTPGDLPTHWRVTLPEGCAGRVVETGTLDGIDYVDIGVAGEARGGAFAVAFEAAGAIPAGAAQGWTCSAFFQVVADDGEARLTGPRLAVSALTATGNEIEAATVNLAPERFERAHVTMHETPVGTTSLVPHLAAAQDWSGAVDFVVRIGWPQLELGTCPTSPIRTAGAKATRDADHIVAPIAVAAPCTIVAEFTAAFATSVPQTERRVVWSLSDGRGRACTLAAGDASAEGHPTLVIVDEHGRGVARSVRGFEAGTLLRVGATLSSDVIESGCVALNGTPNSLLKGWLGGPDAALTLGRDRDGRGTLCGTLRRLTIYPRALGISELMALTRPLRGEGASRGGRSSAQPSVRRPPEPPVPVPSGSPPAEEPASGREVGGPLAAARRLFAFRRRATDQDPAPPPVPAGEIAGPEAAIVGASLEDAPEVGPDPALVAARERVAELEARLAAEQARADALEQAHREEHAKFAAQIATLEATFHGARVDEARGRASELEAALTAERGRTAELDRQVRSLEERRVELEADLEAARRRASEAQMQAAVEQAARTRFEAEQARLERRVATLHAGVEESRALAAASARVASEEAARAAEVEAALRQELETARRHGAELETALSAEQALWAEHERSAEAERAALQRRIADVDARVEEALSRASGMAERLADADARRAELAKALEDERARLLGTIAALESRAAEAQERNAALESRCAELGAALEQGSRSEHAEPAADEQAHEDEREALRLHVEDLQGRLEEATARAAADADRVAALDEAHAALAERLDQARLERVELAERVEAGEAQRAELERGHAAARDGFARQLEALQLRVTEALSQAAAAAADLVASQQQHAALAASLENAHRRASQAEADMRAQVALRQDLEGERGDDGGSRTEELARLRARLEALLAASAQEPSSALPDAAAPDPSKPAPRQPSPGEEPVSHVPAAASEGFAVTDGGPAQPPTAADADRQRDASADDVPRLNRRAGTALLAVLAAGTIAAMLVVEQDRGIGPSETASTSIESGEPARSEMALSPPYVPADGITFSSGLDTVRLEHVEAPPWSAVCREAGGAPWPCGLRAREALVALIKARPVTCVRASSGEPPLAASCTLDGRDLGAVLVEQGWARPSQGETYAAQAAEARRSRRGLWRAGEWGASTEGSRTVGEAAGAAGRS